MRAVVVAATLALGCRAEYQLVESDERGADPHANAGIGTTQSVERTIVLDGSGSLDPDGTIVAYRWSVVSRPPGSAAVIADSQAVVTTFMPDAPGLFEFDLQVTDDDGHTASSGVHYLVLRGPITVDAGNDVTVDWRTPVTLTGSVLVESQEVPTLAWTFVTKPPRSTTVLQGATSLTPGFVADAEGTYVLQLTASTSEATRMDTVSVVASVPRVEVQGAIIDAVISTQYQSLIAISDSPPRLRFIDITTGTETTLALPATPTAMSINSDENLVGVASAGEVRVIDLFTRTVMGTYSVSGSCSDLVFALYYVNCFPSQAGPIQTINMMSDIITPTSYSVSGQMAARKLFNSYEMYAIDTTTTPADLWHYTAADDPAQFVGDSPYTGQFAMGNDLWSVGDAFIMSSGHVFDASPVSAMDMLHRTRITADPATVVNGVGWAAKVYTLETLAGVVSLRTYDSETLALESEWPAPDASVNGTLQPGAARFIGFLPSKLVLVESVGATSTMIVTGL